VLEIDATARSAAPPERVWELLADASTWTRWGGFDEAVVEEGAGLGELRRLRRGRTTGRDRVTVFEPPRRFGYEHIPGLPVRDYRAEVTLTPTPDGGTDVRWHSTFRPKIPGTGWAIRRGLQKFIAEATQGLARDAADAVVI
jgi:uncharacterized protein YndB with AHSA1/START domain